MRTKEKDQHHHSTSLKGIKIQKIPNRKSFAVKELERLSNEDARKRNPNTPVEWLAQRKFRDDTANLLNRCIIEYLKLSGWQAERIANIGRRIDTRCTFTDVTDRSRTIGSSKWIKGTGTNGTADISAAIKGRSVKIEVKYGRDRQSEAQCAYQSQVKQAGGIYVIASSFEQFFAWYNLKFAL